MTVSRDLPNELTGAATTRRRIRVAEGCVIVARLVILAMSACVALDALVRFPEGVRWVLLFAAAWWLLWLGRRWVSPTLVARESVVSLALSIESQCAASRGRLASGVEFAQSSQHEGSALAHAVAQSASALAPHDLLRRLVSVTRLRREALGLAAVLGIWGIFAVMAPTLALTGLQRFVTPWTHAEWPARTSVRSTTFATHHPHRTSLALRADLFKGDPISEPVWVRVRTISSGATGEWGEISMVHQGETRFERLIEPGADAIEFVFLTRDMETRPQRIEFVDAPTVSSVKATVTPPPYASSSVPETFDLGRAMDARGKVPQPILEGSTIELLIETVPRLPIPTADGEAWRERTFLFSGMPKGIVGAPVGLTITAGPDGWHLKWTADVSRVLTLHLVDGHGVRNVEDIIVTTDVVTDAAPEATMIDPSADETVLPSAVVPLRAEARDDVGVVWLSLNARRGEGWAKEIGRVEAHMVLQAEVDGTLDLEEVKAAPGDIFEVSCLAADALTRDGARREPTRSSIRRIRVLNRAQFDEETRNSLAALRQGALRIDERERALLDRAEDAMTQLRPQSEISERIKALRNTLGAIEQRAQRNRVHDDASESLLAAAADILEAAQMGSDAARDSLQRASGSTDAKSSNAAMEEARTKQSEVRSELADLAALLDRDKDAWAAAKSLERVAEAITRADDARSQAGARTIGRPREELGEDEAAALDRAAESARQAAQVATEAVEELQERGAQVAQSDPARAANLQQAAKRGESEAVSTRLEQAEQATRENHLDEARQASASAMATIRQMMEDLADDEKSRTATLRRRLAGMADAIEALVKDAESVEEQGIQLQGSAAGEASTVGQQAAAVSRNALGIAEDGRATGPEAQRVVRLVERGAESESRAAGALLALPAQVGAGHEALARATSLFKEALTAAREQERRTEDAQREERMRELSQRYRTLAESQEGILTATAALGEENSERRALVEARRLALAEDEIRLSLEAIPEESEDVKASATFMEASLLATEAAAEAANALREGPPLDRAIEVEGDLLVILKGLALALDEAARKKDDPFADPEQSQDQRGGAGGGGGPQEGEPAIPPLAELKVLRSLQKTIYERTRRAEASGASPEALGMLATRQENAARLADELRKAVERRMQTQSPPPAEAGDPNDGAEALDPPKPKESEP